MCCNFVKFGWLAAGTKGGILMCVRDWFSLTLIESVLQLARDTLIRNGKSKRAARIHLCMKSKKELETESKGLVLL